ncbi:phage tail protein [Candidatus Deianiraea vastatrix]|uniref:Phage tail collar domain protein n=1 Tax=Candidatus Deianiraea vastatrix TaxID=2163644 RepID=A0A5B8XJ48_9RICK|nr:tail fiber protein [Candidatus Deianiraea vastatrix]QED23637.1 Putative phage tail collar domain protein [Candidatus Deianiraea vastatrix]
MKTKNMNLSQIAQNQSAKETIINENNIIIDSLAVCKVAKIITTLPTETLDNGTAFIVSNTPDNALSSKANNICIYHVNFGFKFIAPQENMTFFVVSELAHYVYTNNTWKIVSNASQNNTNNQSGSSSQIQSDWNQTTSTSPDFIKNKPTIPSKLSNLQNDIFSNVDNTSDANKPVSTATQIELDKKANSSDVLYKTNNLLELSDKDTALANLGAMKKSSNLQDLPDKSIARNNLNVYSKTEIETALNSKANSSDVLYKTNNLLELSDKDAAKTNLGLAKVATTGSYNDLTDKPTITSSGTTTSQIQSDWNQTTSTSPDFIKNKPSIPSPQVNSDWNSTSGISQILNKPTLSTVATTGSYNDLTNKPSIPQIPTNISAFTNDKNYQMLSDVQTLIASILADTLSTSTSKTWSIDKIKSYISSNSSSSSSASSFIVGDYKNSAQTANHNSWLLCNGQAVSRTTYSELFALLGTNFGAGDGTLTFNLPDFRGRTFAAIGQGSGLTNRTLGQKVGAETHTLTVNEMPSHSHSNGAFSTGYAVAAGGNYGGYPQVTNTGSAGGGQSHNNMQPTLFAGNVFVFAGV